MSMTIEIDKDEYHGSKFQCTHNEWAVDGEYIIYIFAKAYSNYFNLSALATDNESEMHTIYHACLD
jgi:hypothetical protein